MKNLAATLLLCLSAVGAHAQCAQLQYVKDEGAFSVWRATAFVNVQITHYRDGKVSSGQTVSMKPGDLINIRINVNSSNRGQYDGFAC